MTWENYFVLRRCHNLPPVQELRRKCQELIADYGHESVLGCLQELEPQETFLLGAFLKGKTLRHLSQKTGHTGCWVKRRLAQSLKDLIELIEFRLSSDEEEEVEASA